MGNEFERELRRKGKNRQRTKDKNSVKERE
jgi:hypothetical protein